MDLEKAFSKLIYINKGENPARRYEATDGFIQNHLHVERFPAISPKWLRDGKNDSAGHYAKALSIRLALRQAQSEGHESILIFSDEAQFSKDFQAKCGAFDPPSGWGVIFFGCIHEKRPDVVGDGVVRVKEGGNMAAFGVRQKHFHQLRKRLSIVGTITDTGTVVTVNDVLISFSKEALCYAPYPNLVWTNPERADEFDEYGNQKTFLEEVSGIAYASRGGGAWQKQFVRSSNEWPKIGFLFLTVGDLNHPAVWEQYFEGHEGLFEIFHHPKYPEQIESSLLRDRCIPDIHETAWGDISLVRATLSLIKNGLEHSDCDFFVLLSESCLPIKPFPFLRWNLEKDFRSRIDNSRMKVGGQKGIDHKLERIESSTLDLREFWRFHSQWIGLTREAAEALYIEDFTLSFEQVFAADESYFGTILDYVGFPQEEIATESLTVVEWPKGWNPHPNSFPEVDKDKALSFALSKGFFARKFPIESDMGEYKLHKSE